MKKIALLVFISVLFHMSCFAQTRGVSAQTSHFVSCTLANMLYFSLEANDKSDVNAQRQLVVNSNVPMNISVKEMTPDSYVTYIPELPEESHGPSITHIRAATRVQLYTDNDPFFTTTLLYTAAPM